MDDGTNCLQHFDIVLCEKAHTLASDDAEDRAFVMWVIGEYQTMYRLIRHHPEKREEIEPKYRAYEQVIREYVLGNDVNKACKDNGI